MTRRFEKIISATILVMGALSQLVRLAAADELSTGQVLAQAQSQSQAHAVIGLLTKLEKKTQPADVAPAAVATLEPTSYAPTNFESAVPPAPADRQDGSPEVAKFPVPVAPPPAQPEARDRSSVKALASQTPPPEKTAGVHVKFSGLVAPPLAQPVIADRPILNGPALSTLQAQKTAGERVEFLTPAVTDQASAAPVVLDTSAVPVAASSLAVSAEQDQPRAQTASSKPTDIHNGRPKASAKQPSTRVLNRTNLGGVSVSKIRRVVADHPEIRALARAYGF